MAKYSKEKLSAQIDQWKEKVLMAYEAKKTGHMINTYGMISDIDKIIAEAFDHEEVINE